MRAPKPTPRERLLVRFRNARPDYADRHERATFARDLLEHERELAERALDVLDLSLSMARCPDDCPCRASTMALREPISAAILGRGKGGRR